MQNPKGYLWSDYFSVDSNEETYWNRVGNRDKPWEIFSWHVRKFFGN